MEKEIIKPIKFFKESKYEGYICFDDGTVYSAKVKGGQGSLDYNNLHEMKYGQDKDGYLDICISYIDDISGKQIRKYPRVHKFVYETFNGEIPEGYTVDHIDNNKKKNWLSNLQLLTIKENSIKRDMTHNFGNRVQLQVYDYNTNKSFIGTANEISEIYGVRPKDIKAIYKRDDHENRSFGKLLNMGINIKVENVEDIQKVL